MITVRLKGGLGNQMFQYAFGESIQAKTGISVQYDTSYLKGLYSDKSKALEMFLKMRSQSAVFAPRSFSLDIFPNIDQTKFVSHSKYRVRQSLAGKIVEKLIEKYDFRFMQEKRFQYDDYSKKIKDGMYLDGNWQSYKYFDAISGNIAHDFTFQNGNEYGEMSTEAKDFEKHVLESESVCVYARRGDMAKDPRAAALHGTVSPQYFSKAIEEMIVRTKDRNPNLKWFVFSDEIDWCKENITHPKVAYTYFNNDWSGKGAAHQLRIMSECKHFIIPNSTFGWWPAWLSRSAEKHSIPKVVICPKEFYKHTAFGAEDLIPPSWISLPGYLV